MNEWIEITNELANECKIKYVRIRNEKGKDDDE